MGPRNKTVNCCTQRKVRGGDSSFVDIGICGIKPVFKKIDPNDIKSNISVNIDIKNSFPSKKINYSVMCKKCDYSAIIQIPEIDLKEKGRRVGLWCPRCGGRYSLKFKRL